jgi:hypothetical protein
VNAETPSEIKPKPRIIEKKSFLFSSGKVFKVVLNENQQRTVACGEKLKTSKVDSIKKLRK